MSLYNLKNPAVKRLMREAEELREPTVEYAAYPLEDNLFEWHFTLRGPPATEFEGGVYHGRISLPPEYPMRPPTIILLTPNGRFEVNKKICLSISGHHPETWQPSWSIRTALLAIIGFLPTHGNGAIGSLDYTPEERKCLASKSQNWKCNECGFIRNVLKEPEKESLQSQQKSKAPLREEGEGARQRHADAPGNNRGTRVETRTVQSDPIKRDKQANSICNFVSLLTIWLIVIIFAVLMVRRVLYQ